MFRLGCALVVIFGLMSQNAIARDKTSPDALRGRNAGVVALTSAYSLVELFPEMLRAADRCYSNSTSASTVPGTGGAIGGAAIALTSASSGVVSQIDADHQHAYIIVRAVGGMGWLKSNMLQFDLTSTQSGTDLLVYRARNGEFYKNAAGNVEAWTRGDFSTCKLDRYSQRMHDSKERDGE